MIWDEVVKALVLLVGGFLSATFLMIGIRVLRSDKSVYRKAQERSGSFVNPLRGRLKTVAEGGRDFNVRAGLAVNRKNEWQEQGSLSEDLLDNILRK